MELTVRGAGIFGLSIAWVAAARGAKVQVIDPNGVASGSSGGIVGALAPHVPENWNAKKAFQLESLLMAQEFWDEVEHIGGGNPGYARTGRLQPVADTRALELARQRCETAKDLWKDAAEWQVLSEVKEPWRPASSSGYFIYDTLSALIHPRKACDALTSALAKQGVDIRTDAEDAGQVLWATGADGLTEMTSTHNRLVGTGVKGQAALLDHDARGMPQLFADGIHIVPHRDGTVAVGSTTERNYTDPNGTDGQLEALISAACTAVPALKDAAVLAGWAGVRPRSRTRAPMIGAWPGKPGHYIANGGFKIGFGMAPKVAHVMTDLILDNIDTIPDGFRVEDNL